ncbi:MAG: S8 family serine peptidase [Lachnospiraceae bacterium]|nr:S8 family serine peptidase [Lachnospiraceae bacterium]
MEREKISPELILAIDLSEEEREKSLDLDVGYSGLFDEWELIVRYTGNLDVIRQELDISVEELLGGYAILRIPQYLIGRLSEYSQIDYIEKPKNLLIEEMEGIRQSCINRIRLPDFNLTGKGTMVACLDSGVDIYHEAFRRADGTSKIAVLWDQTIPGNPPEGFTTGSIYTREDINEALQRENDLSGRQQIVPQFDGSGHGTAVLGILTEVAPEAECIVVKMGNATRTGFPRTTQLMLAIDFSVRFAISAGKPLAINISYGNNYGAHNGNSILEQYMDNISNLYRNTIAAGTGNDGLSGRHFSGKLSKNQSQNVEIYAADYLQAFNLQIWKTYQDDFGILIESPTGKRIGPFSIYSDVQNYRMAGENIFVYYSEPTPYNPRQEIYISWIPHKTYVTSGIWKVILIPRNVIDGFYQMWLPVAGSTSSEVSFLRPVQTGTLVVPSTARYVISVAAYDSKNDTFAPFSGRGIENGLSGLQIQKPDLAAPGVEINTASVGGGYASRSGTSFATPFVTGAAALLMQWGIVNENDPYMFGEKVRASLIKGARRLPFQEYVPSAEAGWGALCISDSIPQ